MTVESSTCELLYFSLNRHVIVCGTNLPKQGISDYAKKQKNSNSQKTKQTEYHHHIQHIRFSLGN